MVNQWTKSLMAIFVAGSIVAIGAAVSTTPGLIAGILTIAIFLIIMYEMETNPSIRFDIKIPEKSYVGDIVEITVKITIDRGIGLFDVSFPVADSFELVDGNNVHIVYKGFRPLEREFHYRVRGMRRGIFQMGNISFNYFPSMGIINGLSETVDLKKELEITPKILAQEKLRRKYRTRVRFPRAHVSNTGPVSTDFDNIRQYTVGDPYKTINWKASARVAETGTLMINQYEREGTKSVIFLIDRNSSILRGTDEENQLEYAIQFALSASRLFLASGFNVGMWSLQSIAPDKADYVLPSSGMENMRRITNMLLRMEKTVAKKERINLGKAFFHSLLETSSTVILMTSLQANNMDDVSDVCRKIASYRGRTILVDIVSYGILMKYSSFSSLGSLFSQSVQVSTWKNLARKIPGRTMVIHWDPANEKIGHAAGMVMGVLR
ncbi:MAG: DUF58 domain-containing protein [Thermoplasmataceae archaeon]|jgi:uncharacterized protein (DUF58 family)